MLIRGREMPTDAVGGRRIVRRPLARVVEETAMDQGTSLFVFTFSLRSSSGSSSS